MSVHKMRSRDLWFSKWMEGNKEKRKYFKTRQEAETFEAERIQSGLASDEDRLSLGELTALYFQSRPEFNRETKKKIIYFLAGYQKNGKHREGAGEFLRDKYAESLNRQDLERMRNNLRLRGAGAATANRFQAYIRAILAWGADQDLISRNPWRDYRRLKTVRIANIPKIENLKRLYPELPEWLKWAVQTAFFLALRPGLVELFSLTWEAFDFRRGIVVVRQGKSGRLKTVVPHPRYMAEAERRCQEDLLAGYPWVCHRGDGKQVISYRTAWENACRRAGVKMRLYDVRHIAASEMLARGADLAAVSAQLGHSSVATTGNVYAHVTAGSQAKAASLMPALDSDTRVIQKKKS